MSGGISNPAIFSSKKIFVFLVLLTSALFGLEHFLGDKIREEIQRFTHGDPESSCAIAMSQQRENQFLEHGNERKQRATHFSVTITDPCEQIRESFFDTTKQADREKTPPGPIDVGSSDSHMFPGQSPFANHCLFPRNQGPAGSYSTANNSFAEGNAYRSLISLYAKQENRSTVNHIAKGQAGAISQSIGISIDPCDRP